jgi:hypothetical protein
VFTARVAADAEPVGPRNEIREQRWVRHDEALRLLSRRMRRRLADALARRDGRVVRASQRRYALRMSG